jgi:hypothetical protein
MDEARWTSADLERLLEAKEKETFRKAAGWAEEEAAGWRDRPCAGPGYRGRADALFRFAKRLRTAAE